jgi:hypothetical protein
MCEIEGLVIKDSKEDATRILCPEPNLSIVIGRFP